MNIILFEESELDTPFKREDPRVVHLLEVLRRKPGDATDVGLGTGRLREAAEGDAAVVWAIGRGANRNSREGRFKSRCRIAYGASENVFSTDDPTVGHAWKSVGVFANSAKSPSGTS